MEKVKTNRGKIYKVTFTTKDMPEGVKGYEENIYATCEDHARQIFTSVYEDAVITDIEEYDDCISEHYSSIPEVALAQNMMWAMIDKIKEDRSVSEENIYNVVDTACAMTKAALKSLTEQYHAQHDSEEN